MRRSCIDSFDTINCRAAVAFCDSELSTNYHASGKCCICAGCHRSNILRRTKCIRYFEGSQNKRCLGEKLLANDGRQMCLGDSHCYLEQSAIADYLNRPDIRELLGAQSPNNFTGCSREVGTNFNAHLDKYAVPSQHYVAGLLERGVPILIYAGTYDWQCNWVANKLWVDKLEWTGKEAYNTEEWRDWIVDGHRAGETKTAGVLTFATLLGAGHMGTNLSRFCNLTPTFIHPTCSSS